MKTILTALALGLGLSLSVPALADAGHMSHSGGAGHGAMLAEGQVKKIDKAQGKITLRHGPIENLGMPGMTMVFRVKDPAMLDRVKPGDNVRFQADRVEGAMTVTQLELAK